MALISYLKETKEEIHKINWPNRKQLIVTTIAVVLISGLVAYFLGFFDYLFAQGLSKLLNQ